MREKVKEGDGIKKKRIKDCFDRLYSYSDKKRLEGKRRRNAIEMEKEAKKRRPKCNTRKILATDGSKLYYRGVKKMIEFDERAMKYTKKKGIDFHPKRFREGLRKKVLNAEEISLRTDYITRFRQGVQ